MIEIFAPRNIKDGPLYFEVTKCLKSNGGAYYGQLVANGNRDDSALAKAGLTASRT